MIGYGVVWDTLVTIGSGTIWALRITTQINGDAKLTISITDAQRTSRLQMTASLEDCRRNAIASFSGYHHTFEAFGPWRLWPSVWMNGGFEVVEVGIIEESQGSDQGESATDSDFSD